jgi:aspartyl protease family protein
VRVKLRIVVWLCLLAGMFLAVVLLARSFPGAVDDDYTFARIIFLFSLLALWSSAIVFSSRARLGELARNLTIWAAIVSVLVVGFAFQDELGFVGRRVLGELVPGYAVEIEPGVLVLSEGADGHFHVIARVNGVDVNFLVDTGASDTVLSPVDAMRTGYDVASLDYSRLYETANGYVTGAPVTLDSLSVGSIELRDFPASVNGEDLDSSLLGMSFLRDLESFEVRDRKLYLRW